MALDTEIIKLLRDEGFRITEAVRDGLEEFLSLVEEENEGIEDELVDEEDVEDED